MADQSRTSYDEFPYSDYVHYSTRPEVVGAVGHLLGVAAPPPHRCRALELGCGTGVNLICMAEDHPESRFVGVDASARQIDTARQIARSVGLDNVEFHALDLLQFDRSHGLFDYVICHGVYSWVPSAVQDKILSICKEHLTPSGLAYVSYNTYPGWHIRGMFREMMGYHVAQFDDPAERVAQARALLSFLAESVGARDTVYGSLLQMEVDLLNRSADTYLYHEHLEDINTPVYFHEFARRAEAKGLQYVAEASPSPLAKSLSAEACATIERIATTLIRGEQYLDFVRNRTFRRTILCHGESKLKRPPAPERVFDLYIAAQLRSMSGSADLSKVEEEVFANPDGDTLTIHQPLVRAGLHALGQAWPDALAFQEVWERVQVRLGPQPEAARTQLAHGILQTYLARFAELRRCKPCLMLEVSARPRASALARHQAAGEGSINNLRYRGVDIDPLDRVILTQLDGTRDRASLLQFLSGLITSGELTPRTDGDAPADPQATHAWLERTLQASLQRLARNALLVD